MTQSLAHLYSGEPDRAAHLLEGVLPWIDPSEDTSLPLAARVNLINSYLLLKWPARALAIYEAQEFRCNRKHVGVLKLKWQRGRLFVLQGMLTAAERTLSHVRTGFLELRLAHPLVEVSKELVRLQLELGKRDVALREVLETTARVQAMQSGPEVLEALKGLQSLTA